MSIPPSLVGKDRALTLIEDIEDVKSREAIRLLIEDLEQFYREDPSRLKSPFDLVFFVEILKDRLADISGLLAGTVPVQYWFDDYPWLINADPATDVSDSGVRSRQAHNYATNQPDRRLQAALLGLKTRADLRQRPHVIEGGTRKPIVAIYPEFPFDHLFALMAVEHALQPGRPARLALVGS